MRAHAHPSAAPAPVELDPLCRLSATDLARRIREGRLSSRDVVEAHVARARAVGGTLNAIVADRFDEARAEADAADRLARERAPEELPPLHGVPCTVKECFALTGMPQTAGLVSRRHLRSTGDAPTVARLRAAGAIPIGVTNTSELCMWMESSNRVYGRTNNPYDPRRIVGGSSGGEGAIVGAGASPFGLGSDIGGSIRMPAFFNGVFGHKPSAGLIPSTGQFPIAAGRALRFLGSGPLARRAEDLWPLVRLLAGPDGEDPTCVPMALGDPARVRLDGLRVVTIPDDGTTPVSDELRAAQRRAAGALAARGARVVEARLPSLVGVFEAWAAGMSDGNHVFSELLGGGRSIAVGRELVRWVARRSPHTLPALALAAIEPLPKLLGARAKQALGTLDALRDELSRLVGDGVLLYPSHATVAPRHNAPIARPFRWVYTALFNLVEFAVTQVPLGLGDEGLPLGVQVAAPPGSDHRTVAVALELERAFGGWQPPSL